MNEKVENLVLEQLRHIRGDIGRLDERVGLLQSEVMSMRQMMAGLISQQATDGARGELLERRVDRIERRLELRDE